MGNTMEIQVEFWAGVGKGLDWMWLFYGCILLYELIAFKFKGHNIISLQQYWIDSGPWAGWL